MPGEDRHVWTQYSMLSRFFGERVGGVRFFEELDRAKADPIVELHAARADARLPGARLRGHPPHLGRRRRDAAADPARRSTRRCAASKKRATTSISPRWQGQAIARARGAQRDPGLGGRVASSASLLLGIYLVAALPARQRCATPSPSALVALHPTTEIGIERTRLRSRRRRPPPHDATQLERIRAALAPEIAASRSRRAVGDAIIIRLSQPRRCSHSGKGDVQRRIQAADRQDRRGAREGAGPDQGHRPYRQHADPHASASRRTSTCRVARAKAVAELLKPALTDPTALESRARAPTTRSPTTTRPKAAPRTGASRS